MGLSVNILLIAALSIVTPENGATVKHTAFDSEEWLMKRGVYTQEAERLEKAYREYSQRKSEPAEGAVIPVETYPNGSIKLSVTAARAKFFLKEGFVLAEDVVIVKLDEDGMEESRIEAEKCLIDRNTRNGWVEGPAKVVHDKTAYTGENVFFSTEDGYVATMKNSKLVATDIKIQDVKELRPEMKDLKQEGSSTITSERSDFDREASVAMFEGKAQVSYSSGYYMWADQIYAFFAGSNDLNRVVATGNVAISNDTRIGRCASAVFKRRTQEIEMYGEKDGSNLARLAEIGKDEVAGGRIRFWADSDQVEVGGSEITFGKGKEK